MGIKAELKSINELVKEGFDVSVDENDIYISNKKTSDELRIEMYSSLEGYTINMKADGKNYYEVDDPVHSYHNYESIPKSFLKNIEDDIIEIIGLDSHTLELRKDKTIQVGCENIDAKLGLKIAKAIMKANGYDISG